MPAFNPDCEREGREPLFGSDLDPDVIREGDSPAEVFAKLKRLESILRAFADGPYWRKQYKALRRAIQDAADNPNAMTLGELRADLVRILRCDLDRN